MPSPDPASRARTATLTRRAALLGAVGTTTVACSPYELQTQRRRPAAPTPTPTEAAPADPDVALAANVVAAVQEVLDRVDATLRRHPRLERELAPTRAVHEAHVALLEDAAPDEPAEEPASEDSPSAGATPTVPGQAGTDTPDDAGEERVPKDRSRALRAVATAEDELSLAAKQAAFAAQSGAFARVLASLAASAAQQSAVLRTARTRRRSG